MKFISIFLLSYQNFIEWDSIYYINIPIMLIRPPSRKHGFRPLVFESHPTKYGPVIVQLQHWWYIYIGCFNFHNKFNLPGIQPMYNKDAIREACVSVNLCDRGDCSKSWSFGIIGPDHDIVKPINICPKYTKINNT